MAITKTETAENMRRDEEQTDSAHSGLCISSQEDKCIRESTTSGRRSTMDTIVDHNESTALSNIQLEPSEIPQNNTSEGETKPTVSHDPCQMTSEFKTPKKMP